MAFLLKSRIKAVKTNKSVLVLFLRIGKNSGCEKQNFQLFQFIPNMRTKKYYTKGSRCSVP